MNARGETAVRRRLPRGESDIDYAAHYLDELSKKPQAVRQVADTLMAQLGAPFPGWWQDLIDDDGPRDAARKMARILRGITELGREECPTGDQRDPEWRGPIHGAARACLIVRRCSISIATISISPTFCFATWPTSTGRTRPDA